jgi:hypothetical protein
VILSSTLDTNDVMAEAGLLGPIIEVPFTPEEVQCAIDNFGRGPDQPIPEPVPYLMKDIVSSEDGPQFSECQFGERRLLLWCHDAFYRHFLTSTVKGLQPLKPRLPLFVPKVQERFFAEMDSHPPGLVIFFTEYATFLKTVGRRLESVGCRILVLSPIKHFLSPSDLSEDGWTIPHHLLPMPKRQLIEVIGEILDRR